MPVCASWHGQWSYGTHISNLGTLPTYRNVAGSLTSQVNPGLLMQVAQRLSDRCYDFHHSLKRKTIWIRFAASGRGRHRPHTP